MKTKLVPFLAALLTFTFVGCTQQESEETVKEKIAEDIEETIEESIEIEPGTIPLDYPTVETSAEIGQYVLVPSREFLEDAFKEGAENSNFIFYAATMIEPGEVESLVEDLIGDQFTMPNSLIIPIKPTETAAVGDVVLTWWQSGSGMEQAIVTVEGPTPTVRYLDDFQEAEDVLLANSFHPLTGKIEPGNAVAVKQDNDSYELAEVINVADDKVLLSGFAGILEVANISDLTAIPSTIEVAVGDTVLAPIIDEFDEVTVTEVNAEIGQITGEYEWASEMTKEIFVFGEIIKSLP